MIGSLEEETEICPCGDCIYLDNKWTDEPCCRCGDSNGYAWCQTEQDSFSRIDKIKQKFREGETK